MECTVRHPLDAGCLAELNRLPLNTKITMQAIKYWFHILESNGTLVHSIYTATKDTNSWVKQLKDNLNKLGFSFIFDNPPLLKVNLKNIERRIKDISLQTLENEIKTNNKLAFFSHVHLSNIRPCYVDLCKFKADRSTLAKIRVSAHVLSIERGRYLNIQKHNRLCLCCNNGEVEDELHFLIKCKIYNNVRNKLLDKLNRLPSHNTKIKHLSNYNVFKLLNSKSHIILKLFANFINECLQIRQNILKGS